MPDSVTSQSFGSFAKESAKDATLKIVPGEASPDKFLYAFCLIFDLVLEAYEKGRQAGMEQVRPKYRGQGA